MYAARKFYVQNWNSMPREERITVKVTRNRKPLEMLNADSITAVEEEVMYWRKANHIHAWFVDNVQNGIDDCRTYDVPKDKLGELLDVCQQVLEASRLVDGTVHVANIWTPESSAPVAEGEPGKVIEDPSVAMRLLPTCEGFFFGSTDYDEDYLKDVQATHDWLVRMLDEEEKSPVPSWISYSSSW